ncbi:hypothetical protein AGR1A_pAt10087 [Agrobacterium fabacearum CFBP 5771]|nr:hypothetical protein AGR1A_pAt10087 [Agrobacterium fabacearum CFBP 5771]
MLAKSDSSVSGQGRRLDRCVVMRLHVASHPYRATTSVKLVIASTTYLATPNISSTHLRVQLE